MEFLPFSIALDIRNNRIHNNSYAIQVCLTVLYSGLHLKRSGVGVLCVCGGGGGVFLLFYFVSFCLFL